MKYTHLIFGLLWICALQLFSGTAVEEPLASETIQFKGRVTAVDSNENQPHLSFTAIDDQGQVKMFYISSLNHLELNDRVELTCKISEKFPLEVIRIRFLSPKT